METFNASTCNCKSYYTGVYIHTHTPTHRETSLQEPNRHLGSLWILHITALKYYRSCTRFFIPASSLRTILLGTKPLQLQEEVPQARFTSSVNRFQTTKQKLHPLPTSFDFGFAAQLDHQSPLLAGRSLIRNQCPYQNLSGNQ